MPYTRTLLAFAFSIIGGIAAGYIISQHTKEEIRKGKKYLDYLSVLLFAACLLATGNFMFDKTPRNLVWLLSAIFILMIPVTSTRLISSKVL